MTWSYSGDPAASNLDAVRFLMGDTDPQDQQLQNEEITYLLTQSGGEPRRAAVKAVEGIIAMVARKIDKSVGPLSVSLSQLLEHYRTLKDELINDYDSMVFAAPYAGGIIQSEVDARKQDTLLVPNDFEIGMHDNPGSLTGNNPDYGHP